MNCPICNREMKHEKDTLDGWCLCEEYYTCPQGHYSSEYSYGYYRTFVGHTEYFMGSYDEENYTWKQKEELKLSRLLCKLHVRWLRLLERRKRESSLPM